MLKLIKEISKKPRIAGDNLKTTNLLKKELNKLGYKTEIKTYKFTGWKNTQKPKLKINNKNVKVLPLIWSGSGKVKGKLKFVGKFKTFEAYEWFRWAIVDKGKTKAYIVSRPDIVWMQLVDNKSKLPYFMVYPDVCKQLKEDCNVLVEGSVKNKFIKNLKIRNIITKNKSKIVICAHYDSMLDSPGANDNASGVAALLELAKKHKNAQYILFDAEEWNKSGSYAYVKTLNKQKLKQIKALINLDMIGSGKPFIICSKKLNKIINQSKNKNTEVINDIRAPFDYWPFYKKGVPIIHFGASPYDYCHDPKDTIDKISLKPIEKVINMTSSIMNRL